MRSHLLQRGAFLALSVAAVASAQQFPLQMLATFNGNVFAIANQSQLPFNGSVGKPEVVQVTATYVGSGKINVTQVPQILGSTEFSANLSGKLPITLSPGDSFSFTITFTPTSSTQASAVFNLPFTETTPGVGNQPPTVSSNAISLSLLGSAASFVLSYIKDGNVIPLPAGTPMVFDATPINTTVVLQFNITNNGSGTGQVTNIVVTGKSFSLVGTPLFPATIQAATNFPIGVQYKPTAVESDTGQIQITFVDGTVLSVALQGSATSPTLVYTVIVNGKSTPVLPNGTISLPDTDLGSTSSVLLRVQNTGNGTATIGSINAAPSQIFQLSGTPPLLPKTLAPNDSFTFTITFAPQASGPVTGELVVGADPFTLTGNGLGSNLQFSYVIGGNKVTIGKNGVTSVVFIPTQVTKAEPIPFTVTNTGTLPSVISNIAIAEANSPFSVSGLPKFPLNLAAGASSSFTVSFAPVTIGVANGTLLINTTPVSLSGQGTAPPALPAYTISGPTGNVAPQSQPSVSLKLASPYPVAINGVLTLTTSGTLGSDPAVQFSTGGRTVPFTIPANVTDANFASQGTQILLQTGTVAETITLTPSFATAAGVDLTPSNPATLQFAVAAEAPVLIAATEAASGANSVVLNFTGYSTTRTLTTLNVQFTAASGFTLATSQVTVDLRQVATVWFESTASQGFGGQFTVSVPFTFSGTVPTGKTLLQTIGSVSATISNQVGASNSVTSPIQ
jgi:hypothetical protein